MGPNRLATDRPDLLKFHHNGHTHYTAGQTEEQGEQDKTYLRTRQRKFWGENFPSTPLPPLRASLLLGVENQSPSESSLHQFYHPHGEGSGTPLQYSCLENPMGGGAWWAAVHGVAKSRTRRRDFTLTFHFDALEKEMATHSSVLAWRIPGTGEPGGLPSMGSHRVGHDWSDLA